MADAADFVPAYDQRTYSELVKGLKDQVSEAQAKFTTKGRFQFKQRGASGTPGTPAKPDTRRLNPVAASTTELASQPSSEANNTITPLPGSSKDYNTEISRPGLGPDSDSGIGIRKPSFSTARDITLSDHRRVHITLPASASRATSAGALTNLDRCVIDMSIPTSSSCAGNGNGTGTGGAAAPFASLTLKDIAGSAIVAGRVDGPVHVTNVRNSVIVVVARQVRIHECENVTFYLHCVSRPIIEDCRGVRFARAPDGYVSFFLRSPPSAFLFVFVKRRWLVGYAMVREKQC